MNNLINQKPFYISNILDNTNESKVVTYRIITDFEDDYCFKCDNSVSLVLLDEYANYIADCEKEMIEALNGFFSQGVLADRKPVRNDAYFNGIADKIIKDLDKARVSIHVCMAWFTNQSIADKLVEKYKQGIDVKVVFYDDHTNSKFGVNIDGIPFKAVRGSRGGLMHNKYCVIDNQIVITGSYNWSENAENKNDENAAVMYDFDRASDYSVEFRKMFSSE